MFNAGGEMDIFSRSLFNLSPLCILHIQNFCIVSSAGLAVGNAEGLACSMLLSVASRLS